MKIIPKLLNGGLSSLFTTYKPVLRLTSSQLTRSSYSREESSDREDSNKGKLTEKDLFELVSKVDALPNDTQELVSNLQEMLSMQLFTGSSDISNLASMYLSNLYQIKMANYSKKEYDKAYEEVTKNGGLNEYAITTSGSVIVMDEEDQIKQVSVSELLKGKYKPLTNSNLLYLRAYLQEYKNNNQILNTVANGIGLEQIDKMIREKISSLGTSESVRSGYSIKSDSYIIQGLNVLSQIDSANIINQSGMALDGLYRNKVITKELKQQAMAALDYIYKTLPNNAKTLLQIKSGNSSDPIKGAHDIIAQIITSVMDNSTTYDPTYEGTLEQVTKSGTRSKSKSGESSEDDSEENYSNDVKATPYYEMSRMIGGTPTQITINKGTNYSISTNGVNYGSIPGHDGKPVGKTSLENLLVSGLQGIVTDMNSISFGDKILNPLDFQNIMYDGAGGTMAILPITTSSNGRKVVDLKALERWENANKQLKRMGIESIYDKNHSKEIIQVLYSNELDHLINVTTGTIDISKLGQFMIVDGYAVDKGSNKGFGGKFMKEADDSDELVSTIEKALSTDDKKSNYSIDVDNWYDLNGHDTVYQGSIYIPITNNQLQALSASGQRVKEPAAMQKEIEYLMFLKMLLSKKPRTDLL